jgi:hypothetical protein
MTATEIVNVIRIIFSGREFVGRIGVVREDGKYCLYSCIRNADGMGIREEFLCAVDSADLAVQVKNALAV